MGASLAYALHKKWGEDVISMLLKANRSQLRVCDRHMNFQLHIACMSGASIRVVKILASRCRRILHKRNFHGQTPLDIAVRNPLCDDKVVDYLQDMTFWSSEEKAIHMNNDEGEIASVTVG